METLDGHPEHHLLSQVEFHKVSFFLFVEVELPSVSVGVLIVGDVDRYRKAVFQKKWRPQNYIVGVLEVRGLFFNDRKVRSMLQVGRLVYWELSFEGIDHKQV